MRLELSARARQDFARIYAFNLERSESWADRVRTRLRERCDALTRTPGMGRNLKEHGNRRLSVTDIQYVIDYRVGGTAIEIVRIQHTREIR